MKTATMASTNDLRVVAAEVAMRAAAEYVRVNNLKVLDYDAATQMNTAREYEAVMLERIKAALEQGVDRA